MTSAPGITLQALSATDYDIGQLVTRLTEEAKDPEGALDAAMLVNSLESTIDALLPLRQKVAAKTAEYEGVVKLAERDYVGKLGEVKDNFQAVSNSFSSLESRISEVGRTAIKIGDQLESIDRLKQRALEASDLISFYFDFARNDTTRIETLRKDGGRKGRAQVAVLARRLAALAKEVEDPENIKDTDASIRANIEKYCEKFENDMLRLFDRYYRKGDPQGMAHCAKTLLDFNGGQSCVQVFLSQHDFFISRERILEGEYTIDHLIWETLQDPDALAPRSEAKLAETYAEIRHTVSQEAQIIQIVFPHPAVVMQVFLQRMFAQVIQMQIEQLLAATSKSSTLAFLRMLKVAHHSTSALISDLKAIDLFKTAAPLMNLSDITPSSNPAQGMPSSSSLTAVTHMLDQILEGLFVPYTEGSKYIDKEQKNLNELYAGYLLKFQNYHREHNKNKSSTTKTVFDRMVTQLTNAAQQTNLTSGATEKDKTTGSPSLHSSPQLGSDNAVSNVTGLKALMKLSGIGSRESGGGDSRTSLISLDAKDGLLQLEVAERMLKWHAEAVGRMVDLSGTADVAKNAFSLLRTLTESYGRAYIETALETAQTQASNFDVKVAEPDLSLLAVVSQSDLLMALFQKYIGTALVPLAGSSVTMRREMAIFVNHVTVRIEGRINDLLQKTCDNIYAWLAALLANKQKKTDYKPRNDDLTFTQNNTEACTACRDFLTKVNESAVLHLSGTNCETFLSDIGITFHSLLLDHIRKLSISTTGGLLLTKDLADYQETINQFDIGLVSERFDILRQLANVFIVRPETIKSYLTESYLGRIDGKLLRPFLTQRTDYSEYSRSFWNEVCGENGSALARFT